MKGDFSRFTFDPKKHYSRVLMQQGRVQLDADWNEQVAILLHRLETMARDLIGPFGGPSHDCGFNIMPDHGSFTIGSGRYYVEGLLCENDSVCNYKDQPLRPEADVKLVDGKDYLVYLDAWEQYINVLEEPDLREKALGGPDTTGRSKVAWAVRTEKLTSFTGETDPERIFEWFIDHGSTGCAQVFQPPNRGWLIVKLEQTTVDNEAPCVVSPAARFRGLENQLYRIEIHSTGFAYDPKLHKTEGSYPPATFKWSRENGSVIFPVVSAEGRVIGLEPLGVATTSGLKIGDWVELIDKDRTAQATTEALLQVKSVDPVKLQVTVDADVKSVDQGKHPYLRRWDQKPGPTNKGVPTMHEGAAIVFENTWLSIEDGIQIWFWHNKGTPANYYRSGDFWYIPARTDNGGKLDWPDEGVPPHGVRHRYAPLAVLTFDEASPQFKLKASFLKQFDPMSKPKTT